MTLGKTRQATLVWSCGGDYTCFLWRSSHLAARFLGEFTPHTAASLSPWAWYVDGFKPDRYDIIGVIIALIGVCIIYYAPRN